MNQEKIVHPQAAETVTEAVVNAAIALDINQSTIAKCLGISAASASRMMASTGVTFQLTPSRGEWDAATHFIRLYRSLGAILGNNEGQMRAWLHSYNSELGNVPLDMLKSEAGALYRLVAYLDAYRGNI